VIIEDNVSAFADKQSSVEGNASLSQAVNFPDENLGVNDNAICDNADGFAPDGAAGEKMESEFFVADDNGMAGVGAAAIADHNIIFFGKDINNFTFAFIAPLQSYNTDIHIYSLKLTRMNTNNSD
jgi:hypothetical protein